MDASLATVMGTIGGAVCGAIAKEFAPDLRALVTGNAWTNSRLKGDWKCTWFETSETDEITMTDAVTVSRIWGERLWARGKNTEYGDYDITGRVSSSLLVTLHYKGVHNRQLLGGVVIMNLNPTWEKMTGYWYEYGREAKIVGGRTLWEKARY